MKPYHERDGIRLFHGDALEVLRAESFGERVVVVTDPVWPNGERAFPGIDAWALWASAVALLAPVSSRLVVVLGCDSDPRFLASVPASLPFVRVCKLRFASPSYKGSLLIDFETAYVFGEAFANGDGEHRCLPGECRGRQGLGRKIKAVGWGERQARLRDLNTHPCPRNPDHMVWLIENFTRPGDLVVDPFCGSGVILWACREMGRRAVGIEIEERWCAQTVDRLSQGVLFAPGGGPP